MSEVIWAFIFDAALCYLGVRMARRHKRWRWYIVFIVGALCYFFAALICWLQPAWLPYPFIRSW